MPFGSSMNLSNSMAIAEEEYYSDRYDERFVNDDYYVLEKDAYYGNDNYNREYATYKADYDDDYKSYDNNDYKSKDKERNIVSTSNINCNTVNYNFNNVVIGNFSNGNSGIGRGAEDETNGDLSANANGNNGGGYYDGYQIGKDITCISNINNNNTNIAIGNDGNATEGPELPPCEQCFFDILSEDQRAAMEALFEGDGIFITNTTDPMEFEEIHSFAEFCEFVENFPGLNHDFITGFVNQLFEAIEQDPSPSTIIELVNCIVDALGIGTDGNGIVAPFTINNRETVEPPELTATEKIEKLKTQWLDLLR
jgi:hypothetical protein